MICKGCTCRNIFSLPFNENDIDVLFITYQQNGKTVFEKTKDDCEFTDGHVSVLLTQEDTLKLLNESIVKIQIRLKLVNGTVTKSRVIETYTDIVLKNEVI